MITTKMLSNPEFIDFTSSAIISWFFLVSQVRPKDRNKAGGWGYIRGWVFSEVTVKLSNLNSTEYW